MATIKIASTVASDVAETTLKLAPARMLAFLQGVADPAIRAQFAALGWSEERLEEAWGLLNELKAASTVASADGDPVAKAIAYCETWQTTGLIRSRAMLQLSYPDQAAFLFHDFEAGKGMAAVLNAATFLQRRQLLEKGADRKETRKADAESLLVLEQTGTSKAEVKELQGMVDLVQSAADADTGNSATEQEQSRILVLRKIHAWVNAWSDMARTVVSRRDQLIKLGIAKRRAAKGKAVIVPPVITPPVAPAPVVTSPAPVVTPPVATTPVPPVVTPPVATTPVPTPPVLPAPPVVTLPVATPPVATPPVATTPPATPATPITPTPAPAPIVMSDEIEGPQSKAA